MQSQVGGLVLQRHVANVVDDEQVVALEPTQLGVELVAVLGCSSPETTRRPKEQPLTVSRSRPAGRNAARAAFVTHSSA
jgi:hypothetical protein